MKFALAVFLGAVSTHKLNRWGYDKDHPHPGFTANMIDFGYFGGNWAYHRDDPVNFQGPGSGDDQFMNSMYMKYAVEASTDDAVPTGKYFFNRPAAYMAAQEVINTHLGLSGDAGDKFLDKYFDKTWDHFDTAGDGKIEPERMGGFMRFLCGNMQVVLH